MSPPTEYIKLDVLKPFDQSSTVCQPFNSATNWPVWRAMKVLDWAQWVIKPLVDPKSDPRILKLFTFGLLAAIVTFIIGKVLFMVENVKNWEEMVKPFFMMVICLIGAAKWLTFISNMQRIRQIFDDLQVIVDKSKSKARANPRNNKSVGFQGPVLRP